MRKFSSTCIAIIAAAPMLLLRGGDTYAYKAQSNQVGGHRHIASEAVLLFDTWHPELNLGLSTEIIEATYIQKVGDHVPGDDYDRDKDERVLTNLTPLELIRWGIQNEDEFDYLYDLHLGFVAGFLVKGAFTTSTHFWDADGGPLNPTEFDTPFLKPKANVWMKAAHHTPDVGVEHHPSNGKKPFWQRAREAWGNFVILKDVDPALARKSQAEAYVWLGHVVHLMQDQTVPAHTHLDLHGPFAFGGNLDGFEEWASATPQNSKDSLLAMMRSDDLDLFPNIPDFPLLADWYSSRVPLFDPIDFDAIDYSLISTKTLWLNDIQDEHHLRELFYLFYTANQHADWFQSWRWFDGELQKRGDAKEPTGWVNYLDPTWPPRMSVIYDGELDGRDPTGEGNIAADLARDPRRIAETTYNYAIRATAAVFELFFIEVGVLDTGLICPADITVQCGLSTKPKITGVPTSAQPRLDFTYSDVLDLDNMGFTGTITRTWSATNEFGITETCDQIITIENTVPATIFLSGTGTDLGIDDDADGAFDILQVNLDISLVNAHNLSMSATLIDSEGHTIDISSNDFGFFPPGPATISLSFDGNEIGVHGHDGPYTVTDLAFKGSECDVLSVDYTTNSYAASEFSGFAGASTGQTGAGGNGGCFVATAAYGTPMATDINVLRHFRDEVLLTSPLGTLFADGYYRASPPIADFVAQHSAAASTVRVALVPLLFVLSSPWTATAMVLLLTGALLTRRQARAARHRSATGISFLILVLLAFSTPVQAHVALIDASGLEFLIVTDPSEPTDSASAAALEAEYTTSVTVSTTGGGTTMARPSDAFDGYGGVFIRIEQAGISVSFEYTDNGPGTLIDGGRSILFGTQSFGDDNDLLVTREVFVPEDDEFCRWLTRIRNVGTDIVNVTIVPINNLGSDSSTVIHATSDGDALVTTNDNWAVSYDSETEPGVPDGNPTYVDPRLGHVFQNFGAPVRLQSINFVDGNDTPSWRYDSVEMLPGEVVTFMHFVTGQPTLSDAVTKAQQLAALQGSALDFMSSEEIGQVVNFVLPTPVVLLGAANVGSPVGESTLFSIDHVTGEATEIGPIGFGNVTSMDFVSDRLLATARVEEEEFITAVLIEIDPFTGAGTLIGEIDDTMTSDCQFAKMRGLTYDAATDTLFAYRFQCFIPEVGLWTIDPLTGAGTLVGPSGFGGFGGGLAIQPGTGTLFATPNDEFCLVTLDPATGAGTCIPGSEGNVQSRIDGLAFHPITGELYGSQRFGFADFVTRLVVIDVSDGGTIIIGETELGMDAIVFMPEVAGSAAQAQGDGSSPCFIATAAYGTPMATDLNVLRKYRDEVLLSSPLGTLFADGYYRASPPIADFVAQHPAAAATVRVALIPLLFVLSSPWTVAVIVLLLAVALFAASRQLRTVRQRKYS